LCAFTCLERDSVMGDHFTRRTGTTRHLHTYTSSGRTAWRWDKQLDCKKKTKNCLHRRAGLPHRGSPLQGNPTQGDQNNSGMTLTVSRRDSHHPCVALGFSVGPLSSMCKVPGLLELLVKIL